MKSEKEVNERYEKKHHHVGLWVALGIVFVLVVAPISAVYICFFDSSKSTFTPSETSQTYDTKSLACSAIQEAKTNHSISLSLDEDNLNQLLYLSFYKSLYTSAGDYVKDLYISIEDSTYTFSVAAEVPMFKTRLYITTKLEETINEDDHTQDQFLFKIEDIKIGRLSGLSGIAMNLLNQYFPEDKLNQTFTSAGVQVKADYANKQLTYKVDDLTDDIITKLSGEGVSNALFVGAMRWFMNKRILQVDFNDDKKFTAKIALDNFASNTNFDNLTQELDISTGDYRDKLVALLNANSIQDDDNISNAFNYLFRGYEHCSSEAKTYIDNIDVSAANITDKTAYKGIGDEILTSEKSIEEYVSSHVDQAEILGSSHRITYLNESEINDVLRTSSILGYNTLFTKVNADGTYTTSYVVVNDYHVDIKDNQLLVTVKLDINGFSTHLFLNYSLGEMDSENPYKINLVYQGAYWGILAASDSLKSSLFSLISDSLSNDSSWASFDKDTGNLSIDASGGISEEAKGWISLAKTLTGYEQKITLQGNSLAEDGKIDISLAEA